MKKRTVFFVLGLAVSVGCLWFVLRRQNFRELGETARSIQWSWAGLSFALFYFAMWLRASRWKNFFPRQAALTTRAIFGPMMVGYCLNSLFPGRVGEPARAVLVGRGKGTTISTSLATVFAERVVDALTILAGLGVVFLLVPFGEITLRYQGFEVNAALLRAAARGMALFGALPLSIGIALMMSARFRALLTSALDRAAFLPGRFVAFAVRVIESFATGFDSLKDPLRLAWILVQSIAIWGITALSVQALAPAFGIPMTFLQGLAITVIICVAILIPASPGYWGLFELGFLFAARILGLTGSDGSEASDATLIAMALLLHLIQYVPVILIGLAYAFLSGVSLLETTRRVEAVKEIN